MYSHPYIIRKLAYASVFSLPRRQLKTHTYDHWLSQMSQCKSAIHYNSVFPLKLFSNVPYLFCFSQGIVSKRTTMSRRDTTDADEIYGDILSSDKVSWIIRRLSPRRL